MIKNLFIIFTTYIILLFTNICSAQYYGSSSQVYSYNRPSITIKRIDGPHFYGPHPGCLMCLGNHLIGSHGQSYNYLNKISYTQWSTLHDNLHNTKSLKQKIQNIQNNKQLIFAPTPQNVVDKMLEIARINQSDILYDLGCGDGRIVITASKKYGCKSYGYEINPELVKLSQYNVELHQVKNLVKIINKDILTLDLSNADVITLYLFPELNEKLIPQLKQLPNGSKIVAYCHDIPGIKIDKTYNIKVGNVEHQVFLWITPLQPSKLESLIGSYL